MAASPRWQPIAGRLNQSFTESPMRTTILVALLVSLVLFTNASRACAQSTPTPKAVAFDDVLKLVRAGKDAPAILDNCDTVFTFSPAQRDTLLNAGASPALVAGLQKKRMHL